MWDWTGPTILKCNRSIANVKGKVEPNKPSYPLQMKSLVFFPIANAINASQM